MYSHLKFLKSTVHYFLTVPILQDSIKNLTWSLIRTNQKLYHKYHLEKLADDLVTCLYNAVNLFVAFYNSADFVEKKTIKQRLAATLFFTHFFLFRKYKT